ncbi:sigma-70 family RNA polymerase sigma factor [Acaryochloris marina]|uniref:sigma-70 family RNA polymerase sigma factor n=1 Tax=Acaryochloris marina TaxID=155978 RepID=UPI0021C45411|nr:sigma-70 family RNA polymerase sigma factor [Acaryochloris marina]BDM83934.1 hypothetical protein AM10699_67950 [Acaryochloris marina MBIC10699]
MVATLASDRQSNLSEFNDRQSQYTLIIQAQAGDLRARDRFIRKNEGLVFQQAHKFRGLADWDDLVNAGNLGLAIAIQKFDVAKGYKFSSYAVKVIRTEIRRLIHEFKGISIEISLHLKEIEQAAQSIRMDLDREPTIMELSDETGYSQQVIFNAWNKANVVETASLNIPLNEDHGCEQLDVIGVDDRTWEFTETLDQKNYIAQLPDREAFIVRAKRDGFSNKEIGTMLSLSGERVRQLLKKARAFLKHLMTYGACFVQFPKSVPTSPVKSNKPVLKRVDASRLGGCIGKVITQVFNPSEEWLIEEQGGLTHAQKHLLGFRRCSNHGAADVAGHRLTPENQRCRQLERTQDNWRRYLGIGPAILKMLFLPLTLVYQSIRGFQNNDRPNTRRSMMLFAKDVFGDVGIGYWKEHPRPPNDLPDIDESLY